MPDKITTVELIEELHELHEKWCPETDIELVPTPPSNLGEICGCSVMLLIIDLYIDVQFEKDERQPQPPPPRR